MFFQNLLLAWGAFNMGAVICTKNNGKKNAKRFVVVSDQTIASKLYPLPRNLRSDQETDKATRKRICDDILNNSEFARRYDDDEYPEFVAAFRKWFIEERKNDPPRLITSVAVNGQILNVDETFFVCLVRMIDNSFEKVDKYYISSEYRLSTKPDDPTAGYLGVRFIFGGPVKDIISLDKVAETPAEVYQFSPRFPHIELVYLDRRKDFMPSFNRKQDPLCHLHWKEKRRICVAVFNSSHFDGKIKYPSSRIHKVEGTCERKTVSFRSDSASEEATAKDRKYEEWMMSCKPDPFSYSVKGLNYLLSSAYVDNELWVYFRQSDTQQMFVEILATNVRISVDEEWVRKREGWKTDDDFEYDIDEAQIDYESTYDV